MQTKWYRNDWFRSIAYTSLFCLVIALTTFLVWGPPFYSHIGISFGYGYSAIFGSALLCRFWPGLSTRELSVYSLVFAVVLGSVNAYLWMDGIEAHDVMAMMKPTIMLGLIFTATCFFYFYSHEQKLLAEKEMEKLRRKESEHEKAQVLSELKLLQSQIEPHFLFNTLANLNVLIEHDPDKARLLLSKLTELLRATLKTNRSQLATLSEELELVDAYLGIQQIRLGERLTYSVECEQDAKAEVIAPLLLQPLAENAVLHGVEPVSDEVRIEVSAGVKDGFLEICVLDNGAGFQSGSGPKGHGIGLQNTRERLNTLYGPKAALSVTERAGDGVKSQIRIPVESLKNSEEA